MGGKPETFAGLSGTGDLIVTCASQHSRNRKAGFLMGQGKTYQEAMDEVKMVVEGVYSAKAALELSSQCDAILVIGGRNSENTKGLARSLEVTGKTVFCVENEKDLDADLLNKLSGFNVVGLCSGSSTPTSVIRAVEEILEKL